MFLSPYWPLKIYYSLCNQWQEKKIWQTFMTGRLYRKPDWNSFFCVRTGGCCEPVVQQSFSLLPEKASHSEPVTSLGTGLSKWCLKSSRGAVGVPGPGTIMTPPPPWFHTRPSRKRVILVPHCATELFWHCPLCPNAFHDSQRFHRVCTLNPSIMDRLALPHLLCWLLHSVVPLASSPPSPPRPTPPLHPTH